MNTPNPAPSSSGTSGNARGSLLLGFLFAWAMVIGGYFMIWMLAIVTDGAPIDMGPTSVAFLLSLPWVGLIVLIVAFAVNGKPRTAGGVALGMASIVAVVLLLVAACFAIFASSGWH